MCSLRIMSFNESIYVCTVYTYSSEKEIICKMISVYF